MKYIISDYYQNCLVQTPYNFEDERTFFCEVIIPILKTFAIHNTNMTFKWCEKQSKENRSTWLQNSDYKPKNVERRLLDGYGLSENKGIAVLIESSGSESKVAHSLTLTTTSLNYNKKWQIIDVRTATVPTTKEGKYNLVKVFELLAHLKEIWDDQQKIVSQLEAEAVGFGGAFEKTVEEHFQHQ
ncbi:hypothetical protein BDF20DRAFT_815689 [Mycotypha africana]|uniref:uncharacterized protein n=1 Tax=Mycotypha africana TaxID=64632 RepID=UPI0023011C80|nr:uncharacterized protein BDF20DRAFT_815689 [Mycotypha africana]KAI8987244.1 hypothetical protein BDF20DRAFT_815689 [Mycotypha africana]